MTITVIIRDLVPLIHMDSPIRRRSVSLMLTKEQEEALKLWHKDEEIGECFMEPLPPTTGEGKGER